MPSSPIQGFSMADNSMNNSFECTTSISGQYDESEGKMKNVGKCRFNQGHALLRKQMQRPIILQAPKTFGRRRFTFSGQQEQKVVYKKRRRFTSVALPTKFLLGGNINDPLNLKSLQDEKINQQLNEFSPASSPMPMPNRRTQVQVLIPPNIYDPLNLNSGEDIEFNLLSSKPRKRRRHRKVRKDDESIDISPTDEVPQFSVTSDPGSSGVYVFSIDNCVTKQCKDKSTNLESSADHNESILEILNPDNKIDPGKISTPVSRGSPKVNKKIISRSVSKDEKTKITVQKQVVKHRNTRVRQDTVKFRANAEKFCYGNHVTNQSNWNFGNDSSIDHRLRFLNATLFRGKDVLDIGCNTGQLSLHIALHYMPKKMVGIDIDKKLINRAQRTVRLNVSEEVEREEAFPSSMATLYGPLSKLVKSSMKPPDVFPNNVTFLEANYVPASEEFLETQKPEYDTILCLRVTKWIHLNFGDEGLKMAFKRMFAQLRYGGVLILEPQPWFTYSASKKITPATYKTYESLQMRPDTFCEFLLSSEVGFSSCRLLGKTFNCRKGYRQDVFLLKKVHQSPPEHNLHLNTHIPPIPFQYDIWDCEHSSKFPNFETVPTGESFSNFEGTPTGESFSNFEQHTNVDFAHFDGDISENFSNFDRDVNEDFGNFEKHTNEDFTNVEEHSNEQFSDFEEHSNEQFSDFEERSNERFSDFEEHSNEVFSNCVGESMTDTLD